MDPPQGTPNHVTRPPPVVPKSILQVAPCAPWHLVATCGSLDGVFFLADLMVYTRTPEEGEYIYI